jgi:HEAT repeat protein
MELARLLRERSKVLNFIWRIATTIVAIIAFATLTSEADDDPPLKQGAVAKSSLDEPKLLDWHHDLDTAMGDSRRRDLPILVRASARWCMWCRKLDAEIAKPEVQKKLADWVLVEIDTDDNPDDAGRLNIGPIPALRILRADGHTAASRDGFQTSAKLLAWLDSFRKNEESEPPFELKEISQLNAQTLPRLVRQLSHRDSNVREAVIRRLSTDKALASSDVVKAFSHGDLATRLAALELFDAWKAPVKDVDPWQPDTVTETVLTDLLVWSDGQTNVVVPQDPEVEPLTPERLQEARVEISKLLTADIPEAEAIIARLARLGGALLPEVREQRQLVDSDKSRVRLDWLRFRLTATDALALKWPSGFVRLASTDPRTRHDAAGELAKMVASGDESLLIELFSHPDPFVRELSLKALHGVEGTRADSEISRLLVDPEPNVRAAVLKQMSEKPSPKLVPQIAEYIATETDPDLIVHAVRLLRAIKGKDATECLIKQLAQPNWQVRAETVEGLGEIALDLRSNSNKKPSANRDQSQESINQAIVSALSDQDSFVVSRAVNSLKGTEYMPAVEPLAKSAETHPELAAEIGKSLTLKTTTQQKALPLLQAWLKRDDDRLRAAAITSLFSIRKLDGETQLIPALSDPSERVRRAVANQLLQYCIKQRPTISAEPEEIPSDDEPEIVDSATVMDEDESGEELEEREKDATEKPKSKSFWSRLLGLNDENPLPDEKQKPEKKRKPDEEAKKRKNELEQRPYEDWLIKFRSGGKRDKWLSLAIEPLRKMLESESVPEQLASALVLVALGDDERAIPVLTKAAAADTRQIADVAKALHWLPWDQRVNFFHQLREMAREADELSAICNELVVLRDLRASDELWNLLAGEKVDARFAESIFADLRKNHRFPDPYGNPELKPVGVDFERLQALAQEGKIWQQRVAMAFLLATNKTKAAEAAQIVYENAQASVAIRCDAFCVVLKTSRKKEAQKFAIAALANPDSAITERAIGFLTSGDRVLNSIANGTFPLEVNQIRFVENNEDKDNPLPKELSLGDVRAHLASPNDAVAAQAAYLMVMLGDSQELDRLINHWRKTEINDPQWQKLVYKAIAASKDARRVPLLEEIYRSIKDRPQDVRGFYWAIRTMEGPDVLRLRKRIREEVGMGNLK